MNLRGVSENYARLGEVLGGTKTFAGATLFIRGGKSDYIKDADETEIVQRFPAAMIQSIPAANHWVHAEAPEEFVRLVLEFL